MVSVHLLAFIVLSHLIILSAEKQTRYHPNCPPFPCGKFGMIHFPFTNMTRPAHCGLITVDSCDNNIQKIRLENNGTWYKVESISQADEIVIEDEAFLNHLRHRDCRIFNNLSFPTLPYISFEILPKLDLFKCNRTSCDSSGSELSCLASGNFSVCHTGGSENSLRPPPQCSYIQLPFNSSQNRRDIFQQISAQFSISVKVFRGCRRCYYRGGKCLIDSKNRFYCSKSTEEINDKGLKIGLGVGVPAMAILFLFYTFRRYYKRKKSDFESAKSHSDHPSSPADLEQGSVYFGVPVFSYGELQEATNNFDTEKELGDGGFGIVYYGRLRDGSEVAVKRFYEHNYRRLEQFMNEIKILTCLHHKNLVTLYGCTSRRSRELLLVYEYIPNGTVADHLHGDRAKTDPLVPWSLRLSIAIETAAALVYLHASDIIHRDVKTNNILLDNNFRVKVADFGLSRLFPRDASHVSTAPQGTPGYVDPEYHQCYQLTDKSDVYSFGVVLIELISSMPAVDTSRHRHEINLANLAVNKIGKCEFEELVDQNLGYKSDEEVRRTTTSVAELAFRCLQLDKELRPTMDEVLAELKSIKNGENECREQQKVDGIVRQETPPSSPPYSDEAMLLKNVRIPPSPVSVADRWISSDSTTRNVSN